MKLQEKQRLLQKIRELQEQVDNATIEHESPFDIRYEDYAYGNGVGYSAWGSYPWGENDIDEFIPCKDKAIVEARQRQHYLTDALERFAHDYKAVVTEDMWEDVDILKFYIYYDYSIKDYELHAAQDIRNLSTVYFTSREAVERAIEEVVIPFDKKIDSGI